MLLCQVLHRGFGMPLRAIVKAVKRGYVTVNGLPVYRNTHRIHHGDIVSVSSTPISTMN